jgi:flavin reductase (DIM6/NTAB) family NADH-FMN oxidoreductase RutF
MSRISSRGFRPAIQGRCLSTTPERITRERLRSLLRETAQPVAVITSNLQSEHSPIHHGATLSSFTSIAMDPYPLVSFSLRIPSRMATALKSAESRLSSHMVINVLSAAQESTAVRFSRPDLYPEPFSSIPYTLNEEGLPVLEGCLGALSCRLVNGSWPLHDLDYIEGRITTGVGRETVLEGNGVASELFLARVVRVESLPVTGDEDLRSLPLLYHRRGYTTTFPNETVI